MLSILIPVYNFDVRILVRNLDIQGMALGVPYEIILLDDASDLEYRGLNRELDDLDSVHYFELPANIGRAEIRNRMAEIAKFPYLLFMDGDSEVMYNDFLRNYLNKAKGELVVFGGRIYSMVAPRDRSKYLRWKYGSKAETIRAAERVQSPYRSFMTSNFLISKSIFSKIRFDEDIRTYGHEDTLFGYNLKKAGIPLVHIDNPLVHIGLEDGIDFIRKTREGIENLIKILKKQENPSDFAEEVKLLRQYKKLKGSWKEKMLIRIYIKYRSGIEKNLCSRYPSMKLFNLYKLSYLAYIGSNQND
jgi:hypothetical protein